MLVEHYWDEVSSADLDLLHENYGDGEYPEDGWGWDDVTGLVASVPVISARAVRAIRQPVGRENPLVQALDRFSERPVSQRQRHLD